MKKLSKEALKKYQDREELLKKHGFKPISEEQRYYNLNRYLKGNLVVKKK